MHEGLIAASEHVREWQFSARNAAEAAETLAEALTRNIPDGVRVTTFRANYDEKGGAVHIVIQTEPN